MSITVASGQTKGVFYILPDHLGTPRAVTDESNKIVWKNDPLGEPFGADAPDEDPDGDGQKFTLNLRLPGQYFDQETGTSYNYFRDYDPATGRYIQSDPIGLDGGVNTYNYVGGNPMNDTDPKGQMGHAPGRGGSYAPGTGPGIGVGPIAKNAKNALNPSCFEVCDVAMSTPCKTSGASCAAAGGYTPQSIIAGIGVWGACNAGVAAICYMICPSNASTPGVPAFLAP